MSYTLTAWPTCQEATVTVNIEATGEVKEQAPDRESNEARALRRARTTVRRYCVHNELGYMPTLTFGGEPPEVDQLSEIMRHFRERLIRSGIVEGAFPYVWVPERGTKLGRLHMHLAVNWWGSAGVVEVCEGCATDGLKSKRKELRPAGQRCVGCIWGHGFVGAPKGEAGNPRMAAAYCSKYLGKAFHDQEAGRQRYRVAEGFSPVPVRIEVGSLAEGLSEAARAVGRRVVGLRAMHDQAGWVGPPVWVLDFWRELGSTED